MAYKVSSNWDTTVIPHFLTYGARIEEKVWLNRLMSLSDPPIVHSHPKTPSPQPRPSTRLSLLPLPPSRCIRPLIRTMCFYFSNLHNLLRSKRETGEQSHVQYYVLALWVLLKWTPLPWIYHTQLSPTTKTVLVQKENRGSDGLLEKCRGGGSQAWSSAMQKSTMGQWYQTRLRGDLGEAWLRKREKRKWEVKLHGYPWCLQNMNT